LDDLIRNQLWQLDWINNGVVSPEYKTSGRVSSPDIKKLPADGTAKL